MRIKPYYCPHCKRLRSYRQVGDPWGVNNCKRCGRECYDTEALIEDILQKHIEDQGANDEI